MHAEWDAVYAKLKYHEHMQQQEQGIDSEGPVIFNSAALAAQSSVTQGSQMQHEDDEEDFSISANSADQKKFESVRATLLLY